jgi:ribose 5-phosphate isomerase RpiB
VLILDKWLSTGFRGDRHAERLAQIERLENGESLLE